MKSKGRPKVVIEYPKNFPFLMFDIIDRSTHEMVRTVAKNKRHAKRQHKTPTLETKPTSITEMIKTLGHQSTHDYLRQFGDNWMIKDGRIFFREEDEEPATYHEV